MKIVTPSPQRCYPTKSSPIDTQKTKTHISTLNIITADMWLYTHKTLLLMYVRSQAYYPHFGGEAILSMWNACLFRSFSHNVRCTSQRTYVLCSAMHFGSVIMRMSAIALGLPSSWAVPSNPTMPSPSSLPSITD